MRKRELKKSTQQSYLRMMRRIVQVLRVLDKTVPSTAFDDYMTLQPKQATAESERCPKYISWDDARRLMLLYVGNGVVRQSLYRAMLLGFYGGLRMVEIDRVKVDDIQGNWLTVHGAKGSGDQRIHMPPDVIAELLVDRLAGEYVVRRDITQRRARYRWDFTAEFKEACKEVGLPEWVSPHTMRHTCAVALLRAGHSTEQVCRHLRHSSISSTMRYADPRGLDGTVDFSSLAQ
jgi:integrase